MARIISGTYTTGITLANPASDNPTTVTATGVVAANIAGPQSAINAQGSPHGYGVVWTLANQGTVTNSGSSGNGINLGFGGTLNNSGSIAGDGTGILINAAAGTVSNTGNIAATSNGSFSIGVLLAFGGYVLNGRSGSSAGLISGGINGIGTGPFAGTVVNFGTIADTGAGNGSGVNLAAGGTVDNFGTISASGTASSAVLLTGSGTVTNNAAALIQGAYGGVYFHQTSGTVTNSGTIRASRNVVIFDQGGSLANGGLVQNTDTKHNTVVLGQSGTVVNSGSITGGSTAVSLRSGGVINNLGGLIRSGSAGALIASAPGVLTNSGSIAATGTFGIGVYLQAGGILTNSGVITGDYGVGGGGALASAFAAQGATLAPPTSVVPTTLVNSGTIIGTGGTAVAFGGLETVVIAPGAVFQGAIAAFQPGDTLDFVHVAANADSYSNGVLSLTENGGQVASIALAGQFRSQDLALASDGAGGTTVTLHSSSDIAALDTTTGQSIQVVAQPYSGPVPGLQSQFVYAGSDPINISVSTDDWFLHGGPKDDALQAFGGYNVLDGGTGSNFLTGGSGTDTFFVDDRSPPSDIWSTVNNFHKGDDATVFGVAPNGSNTFQWVDNQGAAGFMGLTLHVFTPNAPTASLTLPGYSSSDLGNGRLTVQFGSETDGTPFMHIIGTG